jgi:hypothetical protein
MPLLSVSDPLSWLQHGALFSHDYIDAWNDDTAPRRIWLCRKLRDGPIKPIIFALHNPSTAGVELNDPTVRRGISFSMALDGSHLAFVNASDYRATKAADIPTDIALISQAGWLAIDAALKLAKDYNGVFIAAWGTPKGRATVRRRIDQSMAQIMFYAEQAGVPVHALRVTASGYPEHPLYLPSDLRPVPYTSVERMKVLASA